MVKILVIEDELEIRANLIELLTAEGYQAVGAVNGVTGLLGALEQSPDLILCDVMMPELDGYDVLSALRQEPSMAIIPFIFLSALADKSDIRQGMNLGADDYITKPFSCSEVVTAVKSRLEKHQAVDVYHASERSKKMYIQQQVKQFRDNLNGEQAALMSCMRRQLKESLCQLNQAYHMLKTLPVGEPRDRSMALLQTVCAVKIKLLAKIPNFDHLAAEISDKDMPTDASLNEPVKNDEILPCYTEDELAAVDIL